MHLSRIKKTLTTISFLVFSLIFWLPAQAQHGSRGMNADGDLLGGSASGSSGGGYLPTEGWAIAVNGGFEAPLGDFKEIYKGAPTFGLSVINRWHHFILSGTVDYRAYQPKASSIITDIGTPEQPYLVNSSYSSLSGIGLYLGAGYEVLITHSASFYLGVDMGSISISYDYASTDGQFFNSTGTESSKVSYVAPKLGLNFAITNSIILGIEARYGLKSTGASYNSREGGGATPGFNSAAGNLFLSYSF